VILLSDCSFPQAAIASAFQQAVTLTGFYPEFPDGNYPWIIPPAKFKSIRCAKTCVEEMVH